MNRFRERVGNGPPVVIAHRGDSYHAPENTLEAAVLGHAAGAYAWELDVHRTRDGVPIVIHDESLLRTTNIAQRFASDDRSRTGFLVSDFDWGEIQELDAGSWFVDPVSPPRSSPWFGTLGTLTPEARNRYASGHVRIPRLIDALSLTRELDWLVNIELKSFPDSDPGLVEEVLAAIDQTDTAERTLISSFDHEDAARTARLRPDIATGILSETPLVHVSTYARMIAGVDFVHYSAAALGAESRKYRNQPHAAHLRLARDDQMAIPHLIYTVNDARVSGLAEHLAKLAVSGIFTDDPRSFRGFGRISD